jgi:uncharacterized membrane protein YphA (DoxX/SURF4 family)
MKGSATQTRKDRAMSRSVYSVPSLIAPARWIAVLRVVVGLWFIKSLFTKVTIALAWGFLPVPAANSRWLAVMPKLLEKYAADNPIAWYHEFLINTVIPNAHVFGHLTGLGEAAVGISLTFGFLTVLGSIGGLIEVFFYGMAVQHMSSGQQGFHVMLFSMMVAFLFTRAGRQWGVDRWIVTRHPSSVWAKLG